MKRILAQFKPNFLAVIAIGCIVAFTTVMPTLGEAGLLEFSKDTVLYLVSAIAYFFLIYIMGKLATLGTKLVVTTAYFKNFTDLPAVIEGWQVVRDLSNMFFIVILLAIAFGTLFRIEAYSWKKLLPKMVLAAVLINYSRAIVGVVVDASQIIMLTFAEAVAAAADKGIAKAFNLGDLLSFGTSVLPDGSASNNPAVASPEQRLLGIVAAGLMLSVLVAVQFTYAAVLAGRLAMIWFLTVLSPLAFVMMVLPSTEKYYKQWMEMLGRYVTVGPMILFYLWLSMFIGSKAGENLATQATSKNLGEFVDLSNGGSAADAVRPDIVVSFLISTMMLLAGLKMANDNASEMGTITSKASSVGQFVAKAPLKYGAKPVAGYAADKVYEGTGLDMNLVRVANRWKEGLDESRKKRELRGRTKAGEAYRNGSLLHGALGAGDEVVEKGLTVDQFRGGIQGNLGITAALNAISGDAKIGDRISMSKQGRYNRAREREQNLRDAHIAASGKLASDKADLEKKHMTVRDFEAEKARRENGVTRADDQAAAFAAGGGSIKLNMEKADDRALLEARKSHLELLPTSPAIQAELGRLDKAMGTSGEFTLTDADVQLSGADGALDLLKKERESHRDRWNADRGTITDGDRIHTGSDLESFISGKLSGQQDDVNKLKSSLDAATNARRDLAPALTMNTELQQRSVIGEAKKKIVTNDSSELSSNFLNAMLQGSSRGPEALALLERLAETGNYNDALGAMRDFYSSQGDDAKASTFSYGYQGIQALYKELQARTGMNDQAILSSIHYAGQKAKDSNHTPLTEITEVVDGRIQMRPQELAEAIAIGEENKKDAMSVSKSTRLRILDGDFHKGEMGYLDNMAANIMDQTDTRGRIRMTRNLLEELIKGDTKTLIDGMTRWQHFAKMTIDKHGKEGRAKMNELLDRMNYSERI